MGLAIKILGIVLIIAGALLAQLDFIYRVILILVGGFLAGIFGFIIAIIIIIAIYTGKLPIPF